MMLNGIRLTMSMPRASASVVVHDRASTELVCLATSLWFCISSAFETSKLTLSEHPRFTASFLIDDIDALLI